MAKSPPLLDVGSAFLSDFDGTLVELASHPDAVSPAAGLSAWLGQLERHLGNALALVTGRRLAAVDNHLAPLRLMGAGAHGAEVRMISGGGTMPIVAPLAHPLIAAIECSIADLQGVWLENKTYALAAHFRDNPTAATECLTRIQRVVAAANGVEVFTGQCVVEVRISGLGKGVAVQSLLTRPVFSGRTPFFLGDDPADEAAFMAVQAVGGHGVKIGTGASCAHYRLPNVPEVHRWMCESLMQLRSES